MRIGTLVALATITFALTLTLTVAPAHAYDLTGHWVGKWSCKGFDATKFTSGNKNSTMDDTQTQATFAIAIDAASDDFTYNAVAIPDQKTPDQKGEAALLGCHLGTTLPAAPFDGELVRAQVSTKPGAVKASFKGTSIFADGFPEVGTCKYSYKRLDTTNPNVAACP